MYNATVTRLFQQPYHQGVPAEYAAVGQAGAPGEGPFLTIYLSVEGERIVSAHFVTYGCPSAVACGSFVCGWAEGKTLPRASALDADSLMTVLGGLPLGKEHAAQLAITALRRAVEQIVSGRAETPEEQRR